MKINTLARLSRVNAETIRMYRKKGLLFPTQGENGYYEYSADDLQALLFIRKLRGLNISLPTIAYTYDHEDPAEVLEGFQREYDEIEEQIAELRRQQAVLRLTMDHFAAYKENLLGVKELEVPDDRWDIFFDEEQPDPALDDWLEHFGLFTQGLHIPADVLEQEPLPEKVPVRLTVGTYVPILRENKVAIPRKAILIPKGRYLSAKVVLDGERALDREQLLPLITYAREHGYRMVGDTTAFIFRLSRENDHIRFFYRLRVRVE